MRAPRARIYALLIVLLIVLGLGVVEEGLRRAALAEAGARRAASTARVGVGPAVASAARPALRSDFPLTFLGQFSEHSPPGTMGYRFAIGTGIAREGADALPARLPDRCPNRPPPTCTWQIVFTREPLTAELFLPSDFPTGDSVFGFTLQDGRSADALFAISPNAAGSSAASPPPASSVAPAMISTRSSPRPSTPRSGSLALAGSVPGIDGYDAAVAVGPAVVVIQTNDFIQIRDKSGAVVDWRTPSDFYGRVLLAGTVGIYDGAIQYDARSGRFFHVASTRTNDRLCRPGSCRAVLYLAVSKTSAPRTLGPDDWSVYSLDNTLERDEPSDVWGDQNGIAIDDEAVVLSTNVSSYLDDAFRGKRLRILEKAPLLRGEPIRGWRDVVISAEAGASVTLGPVTQYGEPRLFFISADPANGCDIRLWALRDPLTSPSLTWHRVVYPGRCVLPGRTNALQPSGPALDLNISLSAVSRGNSVWGTSTITLMTETGPAAAVRWFEIDVSSWPEQVSVVDEGVVTEVGLSYMYPSIAVSPRGDIALAFVRSGAAEYPSAGYTGRLAGDPPGRLRPPALLAVGDGVHDCRIRDPNAGGAFGQNKIADYTGMAIDPVDGTAWMLAHFVSSLDRCLIPTWLGHIDWSVEW